MPEETQLMIKDAESEQQWIDVLNRYERWRDTERDDGIRFTLQNYIDNIEQSLHLYRELLSLAAELVDTDVIHYPGSH